METGRARPSREALELVLRGHGPYPAAVVNRNWNLLSANASLGILIEGVDPSLLTPPVNVLRASLHPRGMMPRIRNLPQWRSHLLHRLARQVALTGDPLLSRLLEEVRDYPAPGQGCEPPEALPDSGIAVPLRLRSGTHELCFLSTVTTFGTAIEITASELSIESFFPAEAATADLLRGLPLR